MLEGTLTSDVVPNVDAFFVFGYGINKVGDQNCWLPICLSVLTDRSALALDSFSSLTLYLEQFGSVLLQ